MDTSEFDFELPSELIAQEPPVSRTDSRMMVISRVDGNIRHAKVCDLPDYLHSNDLLVLNDTRVFPARVFGVRHGSGGRVELLLLEDCGDGTWESLYRASRRPRPGLVLDLACGELVAEVLDVGYGGRIKVKLTSEAPVLEVLERKGVPPVPPYIRRPRPGSGVGEDELSAAPGGELIDLDRRRYQTVYADAVGSVAAPTAGLHFSRELLDRIGEHGVEIAKLTLHVGMGTFRPVKVDRVEDHVMDPERYCVEDAAAAAVENAKKQGRRVVAVGSTSVRTLETVAAAHGNVVPCSGRSSLFIYPPYKFQVVDVMLTNFHLPKSTLLMMVSALAGTELIRKAYRAAVEERYRFYSYGDCMLIV